MASKIGKKEWVALYVITGIIDIFQKLIDLFFTEFFAAPEAVNEVIDVMVGVVMLIYFPIRGVSLLKHPSRIASILCMEVAEDVTGGWVGFWIFDIWYIHKNVKQEEAEERAREEEEMMLMAMGQQALNEDGVRAPETSTATSYGVSNSNTGTSGSKGHIGTYTYNGQPLNKNGKRIPSNATVSITVAATEAATSTSTNAPTSEHKLVLQNKK